LNEQTILANFYNGLTSKGTLNWNVANNLCGQTGVTCDSSNPKRVTQLYSYFSFFFRSKLTILNILTLMNHRYLNSFGFSGTIPTEFGNFTKLQIL